MPGGSVVLASADTPYRLSEVSVPCTRLAIYPHGGTARVSVRDFVDREFHTFTVHELGSVVGIDDVRKIVMIGDTPGMTVTWVSYNRMELATQRHVATADTANAENINLYASTTDDDLGHVNLPYGTSPYTETDEADEPDNPPPARKRKRAPAKKPVIVPAIPRRKMKV